VLPQPAPVRRVSWPLTVSPPSPLPTPPHGKVLVVRDFQAAPGLDQLGLQWLNGDGSLHVDFYNLWSVPPAQALSDNMRRWLAGSGLFAGVVGPDSGITGELALGGELLSFLGLPRQLEGHAAASIILLDQRDSPPRVLTQRTVTGINRMPTDTPAGVAAALQEAMAGLLRETAADLKRYARV
jgi:cholesterol transport system auxiliary component